MPSTTILVEGLNIIKVLNMKKIVLLLILSLAWNLSWSQIKSLTDYAVRMVNTSSRTIINISPEEIEFTLLEIKIDSTSYDSILSNNNFYIDGGVHSIVINENQENFQKGYTDSILIPKISKSSKQVDSLINICYKVAIITDISAKTNIIQDIDTILKIKGEEVNSDTLTNQLLSLKNVINNQFSPISKDKVLLMGRVISKYKLLLSNNSPTSDTIGYKILRESISSLANSFNEHKGGSIKRIYVPTLTIVKVDIFDPKENPLNNLRVYYAFEADFCLKNTERYMEFPTLCPPCEFRVESYIRYRFWAANDRYSEPLTNTLKLYLLPDEDKPINIQLLLNK